MNIKQDVFKQKEKRATLGNAHDFCKLKCYFCHPGEQMSLVKGKIVT